MTSTPPQPASAAESPGVYDPQSGREVHSGLAEDLPAKQPDDLPASAPGGPGDEPGGDAPPTEDAPVPRSHVAEAQAEAGAEEPVEYQRTEYGSADYDWEPTYSEAEAEEDQPAQVETPVAPEEAYMYETPEWERPQSEPPLLDSGRHPGWDAGFATDAAGPAESAGPAGPADPAAAAKQQRTGHRRKGWRSIPRAE